MLKFPQIALISILSLTACSTTGTIEIQKDIAAACPDIKAYPASKQCEARAEAKALSASGVQYPVLQEMLVDGKVMRDQARVCRGLPLPKNKGPACPAESVPPSKN